jgi:hypothetical protein
VITYMAWSLHDRFNSSLLSQCVESVPLINCCRVPSTAAAAAASTAAAAAASQPAAPVVPPIATPDLLTPVTSVLDHATKAIQSVHPGDIYKGMAAVIAAAGKPMRVACEALLTCSLMAAFYACCIAALSIPLWAAGKLLRRSCRPRGTRVIFETGSGATGEAGQHRQPCADNLGLAAHPVVHD